MRSSGVVLVAPAFDDDLGLLERIEDLAIEELVPEPGIEALAIAVLPGRSRLDVGGPRTDCRDPSRTSVAMNSGPLPDRTSVTHVLPGQLDHIGHQTLLVGSSPRAVPLGGPMLAQDLAGPAFRYRQLPADMVDAGTTTRRAQKSPRAASVRINLFSVRSATALRGRSVPFCI